MKMRNILCAVIICSSLVGIATANLSTSPRQLQTAVNQADSLSTKIEALNAEKSSLESQIKIEDAKRNASLNGVSPLTMELLNIKQDSICLALRSQLLDVDIQILEIKKQNIINTVNSTVNNRQEN